MRTLIKKIAYCIKLAVNPYIIEADGKTFRGADKADARKKYAAYLVEKYNATNIQWID